MKAAALGARPAGFEASIERGIYEFVPKAELRQ
jgi:hypothetical protein